MIVVNFSHPLTETQLSAIEQMTGESIERVTDAPTQFDPEQPFAEQARRLIESVGLSSLEWQTLPLLINLPGMSVIAALLLAEMHGRCGYLPAVIRLRAGGNPPPTRFEVAEILNLQQVRDRARESR